VIWTSVSAGDGHVLHGTYLFYVKKRAPGPSLAGVATGGTSQTFPDGVGLTSIVAHWLELLATVSWIGAEAFFLFVLRTLAPRLSGDALEREERKRKKLVRASLGTLLVSSSAVMLMLAYGLAGTWSGVLRSSTWSELLVADYGTLWVARQGIAFLALAMTLAVQARPAVSPSLAAAAPAARASPGGLVGIGLGAIYLYLLAASGHAASANVAQIAGSHLVSGAVAVDWLHYVADALWLGGQVYIAAVLIPALRIPSGSSTDGIAGGSLRPFLVLLSRFSPLAYLSVALFTLSGIFNGAVQVPTVYAFFNSIYGKTLIIKILLVGAMMGISALTVYVIRPRIRRALPVGGEEEPVLGPMMHSFVVFLTDLGQRGLQIPSTGTATTIPPDIRRTESRDTDPRLDLVPMLRALVFFLRLNPIFGAGVLLATSILFFYPVPFASGAGPTAYTVQGGGITASVSLTPNYAGVNQMRVVLADARGHSIQRAYVNVSSAMLDMQAGPYGMGMGVDPLPEVQPGLFSGTVQLIMGGRWHLVLLVYRQSGLTRLAFDVTVGL
jgi:putative copper export protein